jgi:pimeloyl-ACP methyl ester carboxylesterase
MDAIDVNEARSSTARLYRLFVEATGGDARALGAMLRSRQISGTTAELGALRVPTLVVCGVDDSLNGDAATLASLIPGARLVRVPGDHLSAVGTPELRAAIVDFLGAPAPR